MKSTNLHSQYFSQYQMPASHL